MARGRCIQLRLVKFTGYLVLVFCFIGYDIQAQERTPVCSIIDSLVERIDRAMPSETGTFVRHSDHNEHFTYSIYNNDTQRLDISFWTDTERHHEAYYYDSAGQLFYSSETIVIYFPSVQNATDSIGWGGQYYFDSDSLVYLETLGHGKSEDEAWDPEKEVLSRFGDRVDEFKTK